MEEIKNLLVKKFEEIRRRILLVLDQLDDQQVNWCPNPSSNSISNLIIHIDANISERIRKGINRKEYVRDRDIEFEEMNKTKPELVAIVNQSFDEIIRTLSTMNKDKFQLTQIVRNKERSNLDMFLQCATHFSEHVGQILFIGKMIKSEEYISTSIPKRKPL